MFGILKKKLSKAIKSISEKFEKKEEEKEEIEKKIDEAVEEKIEEIKDMPEIEQIAEAPEKIETIEAVEEKIEEKVEEIIEEIEEPKVGAEPEIKLKEEVKEEIKEEVKKEIKKEIKEAAEEIEKIKEKPKKKSFIRKIFEQTTKKIIEKRLTEQELLPILSELETDLVESDVAVEVAEKIKNDLVNELAAKEVSRGKEQEAIVAAFKNSLRGILSVPEIDLKKLAAEKKPIVVMFIGFNGSGKTTSIAKVANWLKSEGYTCVLAAADTFRAASLEQLEEHADKIGVKMIKHKYGADPAAVVYDAVEHAKAKKINFVLADTAGRVHTNQDLMKEMEKIVRVNKPDLKVLVIDSLTGNDAVHQARAFGQVEVDATIFTKVDVNEKGGAILSVTNELKKPILFLGVGQEYKDFEKFDTERFIKNILG
jgi:fused signal recognition particle receptor